MLSNYLLYFYSCGIMFCYFVIIVMISKICTCIIAVLCIADYIFGIEQYSDNFGTTLYTQLNIKKNWTNNERIELQCRMLVGSLIPTKIPEDGDVFLTYFNLIKNHTNKINSVASRKRTMIMIVDAIGGYLHAKMLPQNILLYYDGKSKYSTTKRLYNLVKAIK